MQTAVPALKTLNVTGNYQLSGPLPDTWGNASGGLQNLQVFSARACNLSGPLPASWAGLPALGVLDMAYNYFTGKGTVSILHVAMCRSMCMPDLCPALLCRGSLTAMPVSFRVLLADGMICRLKSACLVTEHHYV